MSIDILRFAWISLCFLLSFWGGLPAAAGLTLSADFFLLFTPYYSAGLSCFLFVHLFYLKNLTGKHLPSVLFWLLPFLSFLPPMLLGGIYALLFLLHMLFAVKKEQAQPFFQGKLYLSGLFLFAACDIVVAYGYFHKPLPWLIWLFYAPSQLILAVTARFLNASESPSPPSLCPPPRAEK